jgi:hypothetical protein
VRDDDDAPPPSTSLRRIGTVLDDFAPVYAALLPLGVNPEVADHMDIAVIAALLNVGGPPVGESTPTDTEGAPLPATSPHGIRPPSWWRGDRSAFESMTRGATELRVVRDSHTRSGPPSRQPRGWT